MTDLQRTPLPRNQVLRGDCLNVMRGLRSNEANLILTDPPYITRYHDRNGRSVTNDDKADWIVPAFGEMFRILKPASFCVSFYGWNKVDIFMEAWRKAGFRPVGHIVFRKRYASKIGFLKAEHEAAYLLAKGDVACPVEPVPDVLDWRYTGNRLHPTQKPVDSLKPLVQAFSPQGGIVLDPFCGSGSTLVAAAELGRDYLGIEIEESHHKTATHRMATLARAT